MDINALSQALDKYTADTTAKVADAVEQVRELQDSFDRIEARLNRPGTGASARGGNGDLRDVYAAIGNFTKSGDNSDLMALSVANDEAAGYLVSPQLSEVMTKRIFDESPMRALVRTVEIGDGGSFQEPIDTDEVGAEWVGEEEDRTPTTAPKVQLLNVELHEIYSHQTVTQRLLDDSRFNIGEWVIEKIGGKFGRADGTAITVGTGFKMPKGFLTYPTDTAGDFTRARATLQHVWSGADNTVTADALKNTFWALRSGHRKNAAWVMSSATANVLDRLKDGNGDYIWRSGMTSGAANSLLGKEVHFSEDMPAATTLGALPIAFGDFKAGYTSIERPGLKLLRDPFTAKPSVVFYAYRRSGGAVNNFDAIKLLKVGTGE